MSRKSLTLALSFFASLCVFAVNSAPLFADADAAKKDVSDAQTAFANNDPKTASDDLQLAQAELDGLTDDVKAPIAADIKALQDKINSAAGNQAAADAKKYMDDQMNLARGALDAPQTFDETDQAIQDYLSKDENKTALGQDAVNQYLKTLATYRKVAHAKLKEANLAAAKDQLTQAEQAWPDKFKAMENPDSAQQAADDFGRTLDGIDPLIKDLPANSADSTAVTARYNKLRSDYNAEVDKGKADETYSRLKDGWEGYADEYTGWDKETTGPSFDDLLHHQGDDWSKLNSPKTVGLITRSNNLLEEWMQDDVIRTLSTSNDKVKGYLDKIRADRKTAMDKLAGFASTVLDQAEKTDINADARERLDQLANDDLPYCMAGSDKLKGLQDRAIALIHAYDAKVGGDAAAHQKLYDDLVAAGAKAWPTVSGKVQSSVDFDANAIMKTPDNFKGKAYLFSGVSNRMGWDYSPGNGFQFAMTVDGTPVAAKYDDTVKAAVKDVEKRTAKDIPDEGYDFVATVEDVGPIVRIARSTGDIKSDGQTVGTVTATADETVQGVRLKIVALHAGPVTAAEDQGELNPDGALSPPAQ